MAITAAQVKNLRDMTGAGMMDAKKALTETDGDMDAAIDYLRTKGLAKAAKKSGRTAAEGLVAVSVKDGRGVAVEVNSDTDIVAKTAALQKTVGAIPGAPLRVPVPNGAATVSIPPPDGAPREVAVEPGQRVVVFGDTARCGIYRVQAGTNITRYAANLLDPRETDIRPADALALGRYAELEAASTTAANLELWRWFVVAGLLLLLFEWWWYHKRTV